MKKHITTHLTLPDGSKLWQMTVPVISTCHTTKDDCDALERLSLFRDPDGYGFIFHLSEEEDIHEEPEYKDLSDNAKALLKLFQDNGISYIRFDGQAGDELKNWPKFNW